MKAIPVPSKKQENENIIKLLMKIEYAANKQAKELPIDAKTKPKRLPIIDITFAAKIVEIAIPTT